MAKSKSALKIQDAAANEGEAIKALQAGTADHLVVGILFGVALDYTERSDVLGAKLEGLSGQFRMIPVGGEAQQSGALFLPGEFHEPISKVLKSALFPNPNKPDKKARAVAVRFASEIAIVKDGASVKWALKFTLAPEAIDPLADLEKTVTGKAPASSVVPGAAPAKAPEKAPERAKTKA